MKLFTASKSFRATPIEAGILGALDTLAFLIFSLAVGVFAEPDDFPGGA
jgi:hypothetical protein